MTNVIAQKIEENSAIHLEAQKDGSAIFWRLFPKHPSKDYGIPVKQGEIQDVINRHKMTLLDAKAKSFSELMAEKQNAKDKRTMGL